MSAALQELTVTDVGPVKQVTIPVPEPGGLVVLRARNGRGKTKTLEAVESALTGRGKVEVRDGALSGKVEAFGVTMTVGRSTRRSGELVVESLDGRLSVSDLIDPGIKSPDAADAKRIKALVQLSGVKPAADLFYSLAGGRDKFESAVSASAITADDLVTMAERIKRDFEASARKEESQAEHAEGRARGAKEAADGIDQTAESDAGKLQGVLELAIRHESALKSEAEAARKGTLAAKQAQDQLGDAEAAYSGLSLADCTKAEAAAKETAEGAEQAVRKAEELLRKARAEWDTARVALANSVANRKQAESHEAMVRQWREQIAASIPQAPTVEQLNDAAERVAAARQAVEQGALVRKAREHMAECDKHLKAAQGHRQQAQRLRDAAHGTDEVLSGVVAKINKELRVEGGRLVLDTRRGATYFHDLSDGERAIIAVDVGIDSVGSRGVITLSQSIYESLDPTNRCKLAQHAQDRGVVVLTAEASDDDEIHAEVFDATVN